MDDINQIIQAGYAYTKYVMPGPTTTAVSAAATLTHTAYDSGWFQLVYAQTRIPFHGNYLKIIVPGPLTATGATGSCTLVFAVTFSDDGSSAIANLTRTARALTFTTASSVTTGTNTTASGATTWTGCEAYFRLPETRHPYLKVTGTTALTTITGMDYGKVHLALGTRPNTEGTNIVDLG
jgi:hypothetical protein